MIAAGFFIVGRRDLAPLAATLNKAAKRRVDSQE
jgi:hypothetical protein